MHQPGDSEVEELGHSGLGHHDVAGLDVAVHHQALVGVLDGRAQGAKQPQARCDVELPLVAELDDRPAFDELHREVRQPVVGHAAVDQAGDVVVLETGEDEAFGAHFALELLPIGGAVEQLDRHALAILVARRFVDHAHAAAAEDALQPVGPELPADEVGV